MMKEFDNGLTKEHNGPTKEFDNDMTKGSKAV